MRNCIVILAAAVFFAACDHRPAQRDLPKSEGNSIDHSRMRHSMIESSPNAGSAPYELQFLDTMIVHHQVAIDMAQLAQTRAGHQDLKDLARSIVADQREEIGQMRELRYRYFSGASPAINVELPGMNDAMKDMDLEKLDNLKETPFDLEFIRQMAGHHEGAVRMTRDAIAGSANTTANSELSTSIGQLAQSILDEQTAEIRQMREWQAAWSK
jgi:uncharacterized protein (DUF305 family)